MDASHFTGSQACLWPEDQPAVSLVGLKQLLFCAFVLVERNQALAIASVERDLLRIFLRLRVIERFPQRSYRDYDDGKQRAADEPHCQRRQERENSPFQVR